MSQNIPRLLLDDESSLFNSFSSLGRESNSPRRSKSRGLNSLDDSRLNGSPRTARSSVNILSSRYIPSGRSSSSPRRMSGSGERADWNSIPSNYELTTTFTFNFPSHQTPNKLEDQSSRSERKKAHPLSKAVLYKKEGQGYNVIRKRLIGERDHITLSQPLIIAHTIPFRMEIMIYAQDVRYDKHNIYLEFTVRNNYKIDQALVNERFLNVKKASGKWTVRHSPIEQCNGPVEIECFILEKGLDQVLEKQDKLVWRKQIRANQTFSERTPTTKSQLLQHNDWKSLCALPQVNDYVTGLRTSLGGEGISFHDSLDVLESSKEYIMKSARSVGLAPEWDARSHPLEFDRLKYAQRPRKFSTEWQRSHENKGDTDGIFHQLQEEHEKLLQKMIESEDIPPTTTEEFIRRHQQMIENQVQSSRSNYNRNTSQKASQPISSHSSHSPSTSSRFNSPRFNSPRIKSPHKNSPNDASPILKSSLITSPRLQNQGTENSSSILKSTPQQLKVTRFETPIRYESIPLNSRNSKSPRYETPNRNLETNQKISSPDGQSTESVESIFYPESNQKSYAYISERITEKVQQSTALNHRTNQNKKTSNSTVSPLEPLESLNLSNEDISNIELNVNYIKSAKNDLYPSSEIRENSNLNLSTRSSSLSLYEPRKPSNPRNQPSRNEASYDLNISQNLVETYKTPELIQNNILNSKLQSKSLHKDQYEDQNNVIENLKSYDKSIVDNNFNTPQTIQSPFNKDRIQKRKQLSNQIQNNQYNLEFSQYQNDISFDPLRKDISSSYHSKQNHSSNHESNLSNDLTNKITKNEENQKLLIDPTSKKESDSYENIQDRTVKQSNKNSYKSENNSSLDKLDKFLEENQASPLDQNDLNHNFLESQLHEENTNTIIDEWKRLVDEFNTIQHSNNFKISQDLTSKMSFSFDDL